MNNGWKEEGVVEYDVIVHPVGGMQLSEGCIRKDGAMHYIGNLPGIAPSEGETVEDVLQQLERKAKAYYGDDVVVELAAVVT